MTQNYDLKKKKKSDGQQTEPCRCPELTAYYLNTIFAICATWSKLHNLFDSPWFLPVKEKQKC